MRIRAGSVIESALDPLLGAKLSMCTGKWCGGQIPTKGSRRRLHGLANIVDHTLDEGHVLPLGHHPNQRLGARLPDDEPSPALELRLRRRDALANAVHLQRSTAVEADVLEELRKRLAQIGRAQV